MVKVIGRVTVAPGAPEPEPSVRTRFCAEIAEMENNSSRTRFRGKPIWVVSTDGGTGTSGFSLRYELEVRHFPRIRSG